MHTAPFPIVNISLLYIEAIRWYRYFLINKRILTQAADRV